MPGWHLEFDRLSLGALDVNRELRRAAAGRLGRCSGAWHPAAVPTRLLRLDSVRDRTFDRAAHSCADSSPQSIPLPARWLPSLISAEGQHTPPDRPLIPGWLHLGKQTTPV